MTVHRPISRIILVLPAADADGPPGADPAIAYLVDLCGEALSGLGIEVERRVHPEEPGSSPVSKADVAIWFPGPAGQWVAPDRKRVVAKVHAAFAFGQVLDRRKMSQFDAVWVPDSGLADGVRAALGNISTELPVLESKMPVQPTFHRQQEKSLRRLPDAPVILVDARHDFDADIERLVIQTGLVQGPATRVLLAPHDKDARERVRTLCDRHGVDAFLASGDDALIASLPAVDWVVGRPSWAELVLIAAHQVALSWVGPEPKGERQWLSSLRSRNLTEHVTGTLHLAAIVDQKLRDPGGIRARGVMLKDHMIGTPRSFALALAKISPRVRAPTGSAAWSAVGPQAAQRNDVVQTHVAAREGHESPLDQAQQIENALRDLRSRIEAEQKGSR